MNPGPTVQMLATRVPATIISRGISQLIISTVSNLQAEIVAHGGQQVRQDTERAGSSMATAPAEAREPFKILLHTSNISTLSPRSGLRVAAGGLNLIHAYLLQAHRCACMEAVFRQIESSSLAAIVMFFLSMQAFSTVGTPDYIAPEIMLKKGYGMECDWWSGELPPGTCTTLIRCLHFAAS